MKTTTLFVVGLALGAAVVFGMRATSLGDSKETEHAGHEAPQASHEDREDPESRDGSGTRVPLDEDEPVEPAEPAEHASVSGELPENEICPVMGNAVDPEVYVDYRGRRIGFCCPGCDDVFLEDPETYLKKVDGELAKKRELAKKKGEE